MREAFSLVIAVQIHGKTDMREAFSASIRWNLQVAHSKSIKKAAGFFSYHMRDQRETTVGRLIAAADNNLWLAAGNPTGGGPGPGPDPK